MTSPLAAQVVPAGESSGFHLNVAATDSPARFSDLSGNSFWVQGDGIQMRARRGDYTDPVADPRAFTPPTSIPRGVGLDMVRTTVGPAIRY
jgi:hypothetical protein